MSEHENTDRMLSVEEAVDLLAGKGTPQAARILSNFLKANPDSSFWEIVDLPPDNEVETEEVGSPPSLSEKIHEQITAEAQSHEPEAISPTILAFPGGQKDNHQSWRHRAILESVACILSAACLIAIAILGSMGKNKIDALRASINGLETEFNRSSKDSDRKFQDNLISIRNDANKTGTEVETLKTRIEFLNGDISKFVGTFDLFLKDNKRNQDSIQEGMMLLAKNLVDFKRVVVDANEKSIDDYSKLAKKVDGINDSTTKLVSEEASIQEIRSFAAASMNRLFREQWSSLENRFEALEQATLAFDSLARNEGNRKPPTLDLVLTTDPTISRSETVTIAGKVWAESPGRDRSGNQVLMNTNLANLDWTSNQSVNIKMRIARPCFILLISEDDKGILNLVYNNRDEIINQRKTTEDLTKTLVNIKPKDWASSSKRLMLCLSPRSITFPSPAKPRQIRFDAPLAGDPQPKKILPPSDLSDVIKISLTSPRLPAPEMQDLDEVFGSSRKDFPLSSNMYTVSSLKDISIDQNEVATYILATGQIGITKLNFRSALK